MKTAVYISFFAAAAFLVCGCQNKLELDSVAGGISFDPSVRGIVNTEVTKASSLRSADGSVEMPLSLEISDGIAVGKIADQVRNDAYVSPDDDARHAELDSASHDDDARHAELDSASPQTKGQQLNTTGTNKPLSDYIQKFYVRGWKGTDRFLPTADSYYEISYSGTAWSSAASYGWEDDDDRTFYAYANLPSSTSVATISNNTSGSQLLTYSAVPADAASQNDILMGYSTGNTTSTGSYTKDASKKTCTAGITFYHPLTAVRFKKGTFSGTVEFKAIYINGVYKSGKTTLNPTEIVETDAGDRFTWTDLSTEMQDATLEAGIDAGKDITTTTQSLAVDGTTYIIGEPFLLIPQNLSDKPVKITVVAKIDGVVTILTTTCNDIEWEAGKTYTYTLGYENGEYTFSLSNTEAVSEGSKSYNSKTSDYTADIIPIYSKQVKASTTDDNWGWEIQSYQIGSGTTVDVAESATEFTAGGLVVKEVTSSGKKALSVQAKAWESSTPGSNAYWRNTGGVSGDTEGTGWSPKNWNDKGSIDLSKLDYTEKTAYSESNPMRTANCYIIRHAGTYKIPLVYGNAIDFTKYPTNGVNTQAYNPSNTAGTHTSYFLAPFKNHLDAGITSPFIENNTSCAAADGTNGAGILWSDYSDVITGAKVIGDTQTTYNAGNVRYIEFTVSEANIRQNNAVIAVKNSSGTIMWSWHIWTTNDPALLDQAITVTNHDNKQYNFFPLYNLGWIDGNTYVEREDVLITLVQKTSGNTITINVTQPKTLNDAASNGVHYQWGRKDPMPAKEGTISGFTPQSITSSVTLGTAVQEANKFYLFYGNWCSTLYLNLWTGTLSKAASEITSATDATTKTIYDPSPVGYKVPSIFAFSGFTTTGNNVGSDQSDTNLSHINVPSGSSFTYGWHFNRDGSGNTASGTIFFPASGWRENNPSNTKAGQLYLATDGNYHSAFIHATDNTDMTYFAFKVTNSLVRNTQKQTLGCSVRPVEE